MTTTAKRDDAHILRDQLNIAGNKYNTVLEERTLCVGREYRTRRGYGIAEDVLAFEARKGWIRTDGVRGRRNVVLDVLERHD